MAGFSDLVQQAQPSIVGPDGCTARATEGMTWRWVITGFVDAVGDAINLTAVTGTCTIYAAAVGGAVVTTLTVTGASGQLTLYKDEAATVGLATGADSRGQQICYWSLVLTDGTDTVCVWSAPDSKFVLKKVA